MAKLTISRVLLALGLCHVTLAAAIYIVGSFGIAPDAVDGSGLISLAADSVGYRSTAAHLTDTFHAKGLSGWLAEPSPVHVRLISVCFLLLGPLFGNSPLSAEPFNLVCYLAVVLLAYLLGREIGGKNTGVVAALMVGLWPSFLLHTLQLLKDGLFIAGALAVIFCATTWVTRRYSMRAALLTGVSAAVVTLILFRMRAQFFPLVIGLCILGSIILIGRQLAGQKDVWRNFIAPVMVTVMASLLWFTTTGGVRTVVKGFPPPSTGPSKSFEPPLKRVTSTIGYLDPISTEDPPEIAKGWSDRFAIRLGGMRDRMSALYPDAGSNIDTDIRIRDAGSLMAFLPRAMEVGLWAPFPNTLVVDGRYVSSRAKIIVGVEMLVICLLQLFAAAAVVFAPRRLATIFLLLTFLGGVTSLAIVVDNVGALYRYRYTFWVLLIVLGAKGAVSVAGRLRASRRRDLSLPTKAAAATAAFLTLLTVGCSSADHVATSDDGRLRLVNDAGTQIYSVYLSPSDAPDWQEDLLAGNTLPDGVDLDIVMKERPAQLWDLRVDGAPGLYAVWNGIDLTGRNTMIITVRPAENGFVAAIEVQ